MSANLVAKDVVRYFINEDKEKLTVLDGFNLESHEPEILGLVGLSGCGKSTFLRLVAGLDMPQGGTITIDGKEIEGPGQNTGFIFQSPTLYDWLSVYDNIAFGLRATNKFKENKDKIDQYIKMMGLSGFEKSYPHQISGGMAARTSFARTFVQEPELVLLDEPLSALDAFTRCTIQEELINIQKRTKATFILVTHDLEEAVFLCDRVIVMSSRPGRNIGEVKIDLEHPRDRTSAKFGEYRREILSLFPKNESINENIKLDYC